MNIDQRDIDRFERHLNPVEPEKSGIPFKILGYGEISSIFQMEKYPDVIFKRLPVFPDKQSAESYREQYFAYASHLKKAGITLPRETVFITHSPGRPHVIYMAQDRFKKEEFCNHLIHICNKAQLAQILEEVIQAVHKVDLYNQKSMPGVEIAVDAQLSNWVWAIENGNRQLYLIDTSTPFLRIEGKEQLDISLLLKSMPFLIRIFINFINLDDVVARYYDIRTVFLDITGNLTKEQAKDLIPFCIDCVNQALKSNFKLPPISRSEVDAYYQKDRLIWTAFSALRRVDRFVTTRILKKRYEFLLPGKVKR